MTNSLKQTLAQSRQLLLFILPPPKKKRSYYTYRSTKNSWNPPWIAYHQRFLIHKHNVIIHKMRTIIHWHSSLGWRHRSIDHMTISFPLNVPYSAIIKGSGSLFHVNGSIHDSSLWIFRSLVPYHHKHETFFRPTKHVLMVARKSLCRHSELSSGYSTWRHLHY